MDSWWLVSAARHFNDDGHSEIREGSICSHHGGGKLLFTFTFADTGDATGNAAQEKSHSDM